MPSEPHIAQSSCYSVAVMEPGYGWVLGEGRVSVSFVRVTQLEFICLNLGLKEQYKSIKHANIFLLPPKETCFDMIPLFGLAGLAVLVKWKRFWRENMESDFNFLMKFFTAVSICKGNLLKVNFSCSISSLYWWHTTLIKTSDFWFVLHSLLDIFTRTEIKN